MKKLPVLLVLLLLSALSAEAATLSKRPASTPVDPCAIKSSAYTQAQSASAAQLAELQSAEANAHQLKVHIFNYKKDLEAEAAHLAELQAIAQGHFNHCVSELMKLGQSQQSASSTCLNYVHYRNAKAAADQYAESISWHPNVLAAAQDAFDSNWSALGRMHQDYYELNMDEAEKLADLQSCRASGSSSPAL